MRKSLILATTVLLSAGLFSCGGGGGGSDSSSNERVVTKVEASVVKGATVCVENTDNCEQTDDNGTAVLEVSHLPVTLTIKVADVVLGNVKADDPYVPITPLDIAGGDNQTAEKIGAFIHALVGDTAGTQAKIDLTDVKLKEKFDKPLVELLKSENVTEPISIDVEVGNKTHTIEISDSGIMHDEEKVHYNIESVHNLKEHEKILSEFVKFLVKYDGRTVAFNHSEEQNSTCVLHVNPLNPLQFKFTDCSNPGNDDSDWEVAFADEDGVKVKDAEGAETYILNVNLKAGKVEYKFQEDDGTWITGWLEVQEDQQSEEWESSNNSGESEESEATGVIVEATKPFFPSLDEVKSFLAQHNGEKVNTYDGGKCELTYNDAQNEFVLSNCSNTNIPQGTYKIYSTSDHPGRAFVKAPDGDDDVFFFEDDSALCTSDGCIYVGDEPSNAWEALGDWRRFDVAENSPDLVAEFCFYFGRDSVYYPKGDEKIRLADYDVDGNLIKFTNTNSNFGFDILSMRVFRISNVNGKTYVLTYTKWKNDEGIEIFERVNYCDNE